MIMWTMQIAALPDEDPPEPIGGHFPQVLAAARAGGEWAWRQIYREVAPALGRFLRARGVPDAEDIVGETFVRMVQHVGRFDGDADALRTWAFTIARNLVVDAARREARRPSEAVPDHRLRAIGPVGDAEGEAIASLEEDHVRAVLAELSPDQRDVLLLRILGDLTIAEVATVLGRREGAVKMLQARGLAAIRKKISYGAVTL